jgi:hypothetical protein
MDPARRAAEGVADDRPRQTDAYFLTASSDRLNRYGLIDDVRVALIAVAAAWFLLVIAAGRAPAGEARQRRWWMPVGCSSSARSPTSRSRPTAR